MFTFCVKTNDGGNLLGQAIMVVFIRNWYEQNPFFTTKNDVHSKDIDFYVLLHQGQRWIMNEQDDNYLYIVWNSWNFSQQFQYVLCFWRF